MPYLYIIKLGGSVITEKEGNRFEAKEAVIARIASEIKGAMQEKGVSAKKTCAKDSTPRKNYFSLIVVHGAGPFGHSNVQKFGINKGVFTAEQKEGYKKTVLDCIFLDSIVVSKLREAGIEAVGFDPNKMIVQREKKIVEFDTSAVEKALSEGKVPVLFGQMVPDEKLNASAASGDTIIAFLAKKFKAKKVLLGTDVSGIFMADPKKEKGAKRIASIDKKNFDSVLEKVCGSAAVDVTGGMRGKLEKLKGLNAFVFDATKAGNVFKALAGKKVEGTEIRL